MICTYKHMRYLLPDEFFPRSNINLTTETKYVHPKIGRGCGGRPETGHRVSGHGYRSTPHIGSGILQALPPDESRASALQGLSLGPWNLVAKIIGCLWLLTCRPSKELKSSGASSRYPLIRLSRMAQFYAGSDTARQSCGRWLAV